MPVSLDPFKAKELQKAKTEEEKKRLILLTNAYRTVLNSPNGRLVFRDLVDYCMVFETTNTGNSWTYFNEGKRAVGLHILNMREFGIEQELTLMQKETYGKSINERKE